MGRLRIDRDAGTGRFVDARIFRVRTLFSAGKPAGGMLPGHRPTQNVFSAEDMPERTRAAMAALLKDLGG
ncbi:hypothetical protein DKG75_14485 [Zavarzinia compransoris]|uniref:Uncharacterized protein n=2 Tax=Zavarzinia compransoris TaxID=1264899 RepID=A0A317E2R5_9PROT|nr:hypothetical protein DKG75_14485 [Zavarzinia compransoris]